MFPETPEKDHERTGEYAEVSVPERLRYPWTMGEVTTEVEFRLKEVEGGTCVDLIHRDWEEGMDDARAQHAGGWRMFMGNLKSVLETGVDRRAEQAGMKVNAG